MSLSTALASVSSMAINEHELTGCVTGKHSSISYIDVKSPVLCDILRDVLGDVKAINLRAEKPKVRMIPLARGARLTEQVSSLCTETLEKHRVMIEAA